MGKSLEQKKQEIIDLVATEKREMTAEETAAITEINGKIQAKADKAAAAPKTVKVRFLKSPTVSPFKLAYNVKDTAPVSVAQAKELIEAKFAEKA